MRALGHGVSSQDTDRRLLAAVPTACRSSDIPGAGLRPTPAILNDARHHLRAAERSAALCKGTVWQAAIAKARAHLHRAEGASDAGLSVPLSA